MLDRRSARLALLNMAAVEGPPVEPADEHQQWHMDGRQVPGEPRRQVDVGDRSAGGARTFGQPGEWAPEPVRGEDEAFAGDDRRGGPPVTAAGRAGPQEVPTQDSMENHAAVWTPRISASRRAWTCRGMDGSLRIDVNGAPRAVGRDQYTVPTGYGTTLVARRLPRTSRSFAPGAVRRPRRGDGAGARFRSPAGKGSFTSDARSVGIDASSAPSPSAGGGRSAVPDGTHPGTSAQRPSSHPSSAGDAPCSSSPCRRARAPVAAPVARAHPGDARAGDHARVHLPEPAGDDGRFLGFSGGAPLGLALVAAALLGGIIVFGLGSVRIVQLRKLARAQGRRP